MFWAKLLNKKQKKAMDNTKYFFISAGIIVATKKRFLDDKTMNQQKGWGILFAVFWGFIEICPKEKNDEKFPTGSKEQNLNKKL